MSLSISVNNVVIEENSNENYKMLAFSDNGDNPEHYVILQRALTLEEQDGELDMNTCYIEINSHKNSGYGICENVSYY